MTIARWLLQRARETVGSLSMRGVAHDGMLAAARAGATALGIVGCMAPKPDADPPNAARLEPDCADSACADDDAGPRGPGSLALGSAGCAASAECSTGVCLADVTGTRRCCEAECGLDRGRVCSTAGECVCSPQHRDVGGSCLLEQGQPCREGTDCASGHCANGVCCDDACDGLCERCDGLPEIGTCSFYDRDPECLEQTNFACIERKRCRLPATLPPLACGSDADCDSEHCEIALSGQSVCCAEECNGPCRRCTAEGACGFPPSDPACPPVPSCPASTTCLAYRTPEPGECSGTGQCAECEPLPVRAGIPCGVGAQCDGAGQCEETALGRLAAGTTHTCAVVESGNVRCWGDNAFGQLGAAFDEPAVGDDEDPASLEGLEIDFGRTVVQITAGAAHTCVLFAEDGRVRCWGRLRDDSRFGTVDSLLGTTEVVFHSPDKVDPLLTGDVMLAEPAVQISAANGGAHTCALLASGRVSCWGLNREGQCGAGAALDEVGGRSNEDLPVVQLDPNDPNARAIQIAAGDEHTCALLSEGGRVTCWGAGESGQLGYGEDSRRLAPRGSVPIGEPALQIAAGNGHTCALLERGRVRCWGINGSGTLGYGHTQNIGDDETPEQALTLPFAPGSTASLGGDVPLGGGNAVQLASIADNQSVCARFGSGVVRCWGDNDRGQLGYGHTTNVGDQFRPDTLRMIDGRPAAGDVSLPGFAVALADGGRCAFVRPSEPISAPLSLYCWGNNSTAQLGLGVPRFFDGVSSATSTPSEIGPINWE